VTGDFVNVAVRVVLDQQGRVAEVRMTGGGAPRSTSPPTIDRPELPFIRAVIDAVRQWQYEPPADAPIAFDVAYVFMQGAEPGVVCGGGRGVIPFNPGSRWCGGGWGGGGAGGRPGGLPPGPPPPPPACPSSARPRRRDPRGRKRDDAEKSEAREPVLPAD